tara:strand:- start:20 stop:445 length:426 start_codon:yes stop_codon:yes gene_type:complete
MNLELFKRDSLDQNISYVASKASELAPSDLQNALSIICNKAAYQPEAKPLKTHLGAKLSAYLTFKDLDQRASEAYAAWEAASEQVQQVEREIEQAQQRLYEAEMQDGRLWCAYKRAQDEAKTAESNYDEQVRLEAISELAN